MVGLGRLPDESGGGVVDGPDGFRGPTERVAAASWVASSRAVRVAAPDGDVDATELGGVTEAEAICGTETAAQVEWARRSGPVYIPSGEP
jgi:hypothetical protein